MQHWALSIGSWFGAQIIRILAASLRWEIDAPTRERLSDICKGPPFIMSIWHNRLLLMPMIWEWYIMQHRLKGYVLISKSKDGEIIARIIHHFRLATIRGSARKGGSGAIRNLLKGLVEGRDICITPDGSRGPVYQLKPGIVLLAQESGAPIIPFHIEYSSYWKLKSWDHFQIPKPLSKAKLVIGPSVYVRPTSSEEAFRLECQRCQEAALQGISL